VAGALRKERIIMRRLLLVPLLVFALFAGFSTPTRAAAPIEGSGTFTDGPNSTLVLTGQAGGNTFYSQTFTLIFSGFLEATCPAFNTQVVHADGSDNFRGSGTCTGTVGNMQGTFSIPFVGIVAADGSESGTFRVSGGTGSLAGVLGQGSFQVPASSSVGNYTIKVVFT
jgi:hypothetical protein